MANADEVWFGDLYQVMNYGSLVSPRGQSTRELVGHKSYDLYMTYPIVVCPERQLGYKFMAAEAAWILSGDDRVETIKPFSKDISNFSDDGTTFFGAYGPKVVKQLPYVVESLVKDGHSRQAVVNIWRESPPPSKDVPCTVSLQFLLRDKLVYCVASMRSSDLWLGHPYDVFNFSMISAAVALDLRAAGIPANLGRLHLTAGSKHIYERNFAQVAEILKIYRGRGSEVTNWGPQVDLDKFRDRSDLVSFLWEAARSGKLKEDDTWAV